MKKLVLIASVAAAAAIFPATAFAAFNGVVVGKSPGRLAVAANGGIVHTVRTRARARVGARVHVSGSTVRVIGRATRVRIHAVIVRRARASTFLAGGRSLFAVRTHGRALMSIVQTGPATGAVVNTTATVSPTGQLQAESTEVVGHLNSIQVDAVVTSVAAGSITLSVNGQPLTIALPAGIQLPASLVGQTVSLKLNLRGAEPTAKEDDDDQGDNDDQGDDNDDQGDDNDDQGDDDGD